MNQYERTNATRMIEGYDLRVTPCKTRQEEFAAAKAECLRNLRNQLENVENLTFDEYIAERRERANPSPAPSTGEKRSEE